MNYKLDQVVTLRSGEQAKITEVPSGSYPLFTMIFTESKYCKGMEFSLTRREMALNT